ncbi:hypothetical protein ATY78_18195 [Rhizobium sp. R635]|uniref:hypothetical protein n=1 Tax=Rhizobium sp. R635 TaxID=1764275 RepID=UPI000B535C25|nr:hypothetical protein [Rhizobium sp. R635]OWV89826.1 hypothetical protein ATY78_18195 [Rhizobium sp. R635]
MATTFQFALGSALSGVPWNSTGQALLQDGMQGANGTSLFFAAQNAVAALVKVLNSGEIDWSQGSDENNNPTWNACLQTGLFTLGITLVAAADSDILGGNTLPPVFSWQGNDYNVVGTFTGTVTINDTSVWMIQVPVGLASTVAVTALASYAWAGLISPLLNGFYQGVKSCFAQADGIASAEDAAAASEEAAAEAAVEETAVEDAVVSLETGGAAFIAIILIAAIPLLLAALDHTTYHNLRLYNLTPYQVVWQTPAIYGNEATLISMPVSGDGSGAWDFTVPPLGSVSPPGGASIDVATEAGFAFASTSGFAGFAYVLPMTLIDPSSGAVLAEAAALFDLPWGAHNSLYGSFDETNPEYLFERWDGALKQTQYSVNTEISGASVTMTLTYDSISGEQTAPNGQSAYLYNSLLVFSVTSASS